ncbi:MAG: hypothetical protein AAF740_05335 [Bacteroidota bacterium]
MRYFIFLLLAGLAFSCHQTKNYPTDIMAEEITPSEGLFSDGEEAGEIIDPELNELSGLAASQKSDTVLWTHNDSGSDPIIYTISTSGRALGKFSLSGVEAVDYEDIAIGKGQVFLADMGDNEAIRDYVSIYHFPEPDLSVTEIKNIQKIQYTYPEGARDAETLLYDPISDSLFVLSKREENVSLFSLPTAAEQPVVANYQLTIPYRNFTSGDISPSGTEIIAKTYEIILYWKRDSSETVAEAMAREPIFLPYTPEPQGESLAWLSNGIDFVTTTEKKQGKPVLLKRYRRKLRSF